MFKTIDKLGNMRDEKGRLYLSRCPKCKRENWIMFVAAGQCAWCGWEESDEK